MRSFAAPSIMTSSTSRLDSSSSIGHILAAASVNQPTSSGNLHDVTHADLVFEQNEESIDKEEPDLINNRLNLKVKAKKIVSLELMFDK